MKKRVEFTPNEAFSGKNYWDGDDDIVGFMCSYLEVDWDKDGKANKFVAVGSGKDKEGKTYKTMWVVTEEEFSKDMTAGEIFTMGWAHYDL